jgi:hypothetical protein
MNTIVLFSYNGSTDIVNATVLPSPAYVFKARLSPDTAALTWYTIISLPSAGAAEKVKVVPLRL